jgi:hypothetical protein
MWKGECYCQAFKPFKLYVVYLSVCVVDDPIDMHKSFLGDCLSCSLIIVIAEAERLFREEQEAIRAKEANEQETRILEELRRKVGQVFF